MKNIRDSVHDIIAERILPWIERDGISKLLLPEQITPADCIEPAKGNRRGHIRYYEYLIGFGLTGKTPYCVGDKVFVFTPGTIVLMPRWTPHGTVQLKVRRVNEIDLDQSSLSLWMILTTVGAHAQILHDTGDADVINGSNPYMLLGRDLDRLMTRLLEEVRSRPLNYARIGKCILTEFLERCLRAVVTTDASTSTVYISRTMAQRKARKQKPDLSSAKKKRSKKRRTSTPAHKTAPPITAPGAASGQLPTRIQAAREFIHSNYHMPIALGDISRAANISADHFGRQFKTAIGFTPIQYLSKVRIEMAERLLLTNLKICEVARMVGIEDARYFSRLFHQSNGISPLQYRRKMTQKTGTKS